jgi:hypothetical protein
MKHIKLLFLAVGLFIQGCVTPLITHDRLPVGNEAVVVYHMYYIVPENTPSYDPFGLKTWLDAKWKDDYTIYSVTWGSNQMEDQRLYARHRLHDQKNNKMYMMAIIPAGTWHAKNLVASYYSKGSMKITSPEYNEVNSPFIFTIQPGEVLYLGDIHIQPPGIYQFENKLADAKNYMKTIYPILGDRLIYKPMTVRNDK